MTRNLKVFAVLFVLILSAAFADAQACGGSVRHIILEYPDRATKPESVKYELYYLMPKEDIGGDWQRQAAFINEFLNGVSNDKNSPAWQRHHDGETFLSVPGTRAEAYINDYRLEDFKFIYTNEWRKHHLPQLKGEFADGRLGLKTLETDRTTFIMMVTAAGYETQYLLNDFLGGCHYNYTDRNGPTWMQKIVMKKAAKT